MNSVIALVDGDYARRAKVARFLSEQRCHVEPFENLSEFSQVRHDQRLVLVHDQGTLLAAVIDHCRENDLLASVVAFAENPGADAVVTALRMGALDYFDWAKGLAELSCKLSPWMDAARTEWPERQRRMASMRLVQRLTRREREVLTYITMGHSTRSISERLLISYRTVELHRAHVLEKLVASNSSAAVRIAMEAGIAV